MAEQTILIAEDDPDIRDGVRILLSGGLRVCEELRKLSTVPILFLTAKSQESDKLLGLTAGGDDYLPKPFSFAELSARVKALLRRYCVYQGKGQAPARAEVQDPAAAHAEPPAHLPGTGDLRGCVAGTLFLHLQRHRDGTYPQSADED
mgnify:CR=1 FL=1